MERDLFVAHCQSILNVGTQYVMRDQIPASATVLMETWTLRVQIIAVERFDVASPAQMLEAFRDHTPKRS